MPTNNIKKCFDRTEGNTVELKQECADFTGMSLRRIQQLYSNPDSLINHENIAKLQQFFGNKWGRLVLMDEIIDNRNSDVEKSVNAILERVIA